MESKLTGIPETMLIPLWAKAAETSIDEPIIRDKKAVEMISVIDYDFSKFDRSWMTQTGVAIRTELFDRAVNEFLDRKPNATIINLGAGLDTRFERLEDERIHCWVDIDLPDAMEIRKEFFTEKENYRCIAQSMFDDSWMLEIPLSNEPVLIIAEGLFMYFAEEEIRPFFDRLVERFPGAEMLFEMLAPFMVGKSKKHETVSKIDSQAEFKWGLKNSRSMETWNDAIRFQQEWNYFDFHKRRWKWIGVIARMPFIRSMMASRIVHVAFV